MNLNSSPSPFPMHDNDHHYHLFFNSTQDQIGYYGLHYRQSQHNMVEDSGYQGGSTYEIKNKVDTGLKLTLWKKEDRGHESTAEDRNPVKWMSSKMRLMQKMKGPSSTVDDRKLQPSSSAETDLSSNSPIRVCADCNTTKTPLWRSGPKGPKSLCNACGIRQRKARRAMAAAAAAAAASGTAEQPSAVKIKVHNKEKAAKNGHSSQLKKRCKTALSATAAVGSPSNSQKRTGFEDFLINLSKNLAFHRVFPEEEKDAAILLMALSSGMVNG